MMSVDVTVKTEGNYWGVVHTLGNNGLNPWSLVISVVHTLGNDGLNLQPLVSWVWSIFWATMG